MLVQSCVLDRGRNLGPTIVAGDGTARYSENLGESEESEEYGFECDGNHLV